jgi:putative methionine-R-sulfoxide reductase with GAF domain
MRDYTKVLAALTPPPTGDRTAVMQAVVDALWAELHDKNVSWIGFYLRDPAGEGLVLGPRRDKPACSPIGMHGACGQAFNNRRPLVVTDVNNLRAGYIACDPRDRSELVIPLFDGYEPYAVLDADSHAHAAFSEVDVRGMQKILEHTGLTLQRGLVAADIV